MTPADDPFGDTDESPSFDYYDDDDLKGEQRAPGKDTLAADDKRGFLGRIKSLGGSDRSAGEHVVTHDGPSMLAELGISKTQVFAVLALLVVGGLIFLLRFGGDPRQISDTIRARFGLAADPVAVEFVRPLTATSFAATLDGERVVVHLVGLSEPARRCPASSGGAALIGSNLGKRKSPIRLEFTVAGKTSPAGDLLAVVDNGSLNSELLGRGLASLNIEEAKQAEIYGPLSKPAASARKERRGLYSCP